MDPPVRVTPYVWESHPGRLSVTIACELAFRLVQGADAQPIEPLRSYDDDLAAMALSDVRSPYKPRCDVLVVGHVFTPVSGPEVQRLLVRVRVGSFAKTIYVTGDRLWTRSTTGLAAAAPRTFRRMLIAPERAQRSHENPRGLDPEAVRLEQRLALPNLEPVAQGQEAYMGPVPPNAPRRAAHLNQRAAAWAHALFSGQRAGPPPDQAAFAYFNLAPVDQQVAEIPFGASISLEGLHPEHALFASRLPASRVRAYVFDPERRAHVEVEMRIDTLWIDADRQVASLVVRGVAPVSHPDVVKHITVRTEPFQRTAATSAPLFRTHGADTMAPGTHAPRQSVADLPFMRPPAGRSPEPLNEPRFEPPPADVASTSRLDGLELEDDQESTRNAPRRKVITQEILLEAPTAATPFEATGSRASAPLDARVEEDTTQNLGSERSQTDQPPPTVAPSDDSAEDLTLAPYARSTADVEHTTSGEATAVVATGGPVAAMEIVRLKPPNLPPTPPPPLPPKPAAVEQVPRKPALVNKLLETAGQARLGMVKLGAAKLGAQPEPEGSKTPAESEDLPAVKTSRLASLAEESTDTHHAQVVRVVEARTLEEAEAEADRDAFEFPLPPSDGFEVDGVTLEHCAAIRATLAMPGASRAEILEKNDLDDATWIRIEKAHMARIDQETSRGISDLLNRYDASYVAAQDQLRHPIGVKEFARIAHGRETATLAETLSELAIPRSELMRLDRVWKQRRIAYPEVEKAIVAALQALESEK